MDSSDFANSVERAVAELNVAEDHCIDARDSIDQYTSIIEPDLNELLSPETARQVGFSMIQLDLAVDAVRSFVAQLKAEAPPILERMIADMKNSTTEDDASPFVATAKELQAKHVEVIESLGQRLIEIANRKPKPLPPKISPEESARRRALLSPDARKIAEGFDELLGEDSTMNPKIHFGKLPEELTKPSSKY